ncbi:hypothetical protein BDZ91DRAFT_342713 [Kalaharituber pfeilii]|nr:hypothetical protein BDZ91DRAFT_342713 [Kalaharituber pfeilii]
MSLTRFTPVPSRTVDGKTLQQRSAIYDGRRLAPAEHKCFRNAWYVMRLARFPFLTPCTSFFFSFLFFFSFSPLVFGSFLQLFAGRPPHDHRAELNSSAGWGCPLPGLMRWVEASVIAGALLTSSPEGTG